MRHTIGSVVGLLLAGRTVLMFDPVILRREDFVTDVTLQFVSRQFLLLLDQVDHLDLLDRLRSMFRHQMGLEIFLFDKTDITFGADKL